MSDKALLENIIENLELCKELHLETTQRDIEKKFVRNLEVALAKYKHDSNYKENMLIFGDSIVEGGGSTNPAELCYNGLLNLHLQDLQNGSSAGEYTFYPYHSLQGSSTGTWTHVMNDFNVVGSGMTDPDHLTGKDRGWAKTTEDGAKWTISALGYNLKILFASDGVFTGETAGSVSITIGGGTATVYDLSGEDKYKWIDIDTSQSVVDVEIEAHVGTNQYVAFSNVHYIKEINGLKAYNIACGGSAAHHWKDRLNIVDAYAPKLSLIGLGGNDIFQGRTAEQYESDLEDVILKLTGYGEVIFCYCFPVDVEHNEFWGTTQEGIELLEKAEQFKEIAYKLCIENDVLFIDLHKAIVDGKTMTSNGLLGDIVHPNDAGYEVLWQYLKKTIF